MLAIAPSIVAVVFLTIPVAIVMVCVAIIRGEKRHDSPPMAVTLLALASNLFVLLGKNMRNWFHASVKKVTLKATTSPALHEESS